VVIAEAARLADERGLESLTLAAIAERFGVAVPSLYKHVAGLDAVRRGIAILALDELGAAMAQADGLRAVAHAYRRYATAHPGRYAASLRAAPADDPDHAATADRVLATVTRVLAGHGLSGTAAVDGARLLRATLHGFVALEAAGGFGMPRPVDDSFDAALDALEAGLDRLGGRTGA
jgi:AcrR family transcriptional regulator